MDRVLYVGFSSDSGLCVCKRQGGDAPSSAEALLKDTRELMA